MGGQPLDGVDRRILYLLQRNAREYTATEIAREVSVSANTVRNRIERLEQRGIVTGYGVDIDYDRAGLQLRYLFVCTAKVDERDRLVQEALEIPGVIRVQELMTGTHNVHLEVVGTDNDDIAHIVQLIDDTGLTIESEVLIRKEFDAPLRHFASESV